MFFSLMAGASEKKVNVSSPDVNGDGVVNAQDLVALINYEQEKKDCPKTKIVVLSRPSRDGSRTAGQQGIGVDEIHQCPAEDGGLQSGTVR